MDGLFKEEVPTPGEPPVEAPLLSARTLGSELSNLYANLSPYNKSIGIMLLTVIAMIGPAYVYCMRSLKGGADEMMTIIWIAAIIIFGVVEAACIQDDFDGDGLAVVETYFANVAAVAAKKPTILGHFDLIKKVNGSGKFFDESDPRYTAAAHKALEAAAQAGCVLEVNTSSVYRGFREDYFPSPAILKEWLTMGGNVTITADAHEAKALTFGFEEAAAQLKELGYTRVLVLGKDGFAPCEL